MKEIFSPFLRSVCWFKGDALSSFLVVSDVVVADNDPLSSGVVALTDEDDDNCCCGAFSSTCVKKEKKRKQVFIRKQIHFPCYFFGPLLSFIAFFFSSNSITEHDITLDQPWYT